MESSNERQVISCPDEMWTPEIGIMESERGEAVIKTATGYAIAQKDGAGKIVFECKTEAEAWAAMQSAGEDIVCYYPELLEV